MKKLSILFLGTLFTLNLYAGTTTCDTLNASVADLETSVTNQQKLVSKLSDDIGTMADRIGTMADRIVVTEKLLANTLLTLTGNSSLENSVVLTSPLDSTTASKSTAPNITLSNSASQYLLYASTDANFQRAKSLVIYIDSSDRLTKAWAQVANLAANNNDIIYIAVKSINDNVVSTLSNSVKLTVQ